MIFVCFDEVKLQKKSDIALLCLQFFGCGVAFRCFGDKKGGCVRMDASSLMIAALFPSGMGESFSSCYFTISFLPPTT